MIFDVASHSAFQVLLPVGHRLRQDPHPDHRVGVRAPADHVVLLLLRPPHTRMRVPGRTLVLHQGKSMDEWELLYSNLPIKM